MTGIQIGFVGLGRMGGNMCRRLSDEGYDVRVVCDRYLTVAEGLAEEIGVDAVGSAAEVAEKCDVIFTVVTDDAAMEEIYFGQAGLLGRAAGKTFINCATVTPEIHERVEAAVREAGGRTLAASMASSIPQARDGSLYLMVGGDAEVYEEQKELLEVLSKTLRHVGRTGDAARIKSLVNMVMNINTAGLAEGLGVGEKLGIDLKMLCEIFAQTGANSRVLETDAEDMLEREHDCFFSAAHAAKDSGIANGLARQCGIEVPLSQATEKQYRKMMEHGMGELDKSGIAELTFAGRLRERR